MTAIAAGAPVAGRLRTAAGPFLGLLPFSETDADYFFGRDADREIIVANLIASRLTLLYAPSGVGKTSVLLAGVVHDLLELAADNSLDRPEYLPVVVRRWSGNPIAAIDDAIARAAAALPVAAVPPAAGSNLVDRIHAWSERTDTTLLLVLDQFEEFLLYHGDSWEPGGVARELARALSAPGIPANFLLGLREDALASLDRFKGRVPRLFDNYLRLAHLDVEAGREAIVGPLERWNLDHPDDAMEIEPALVERVLDEVHTGRISLSGNGAGAAVTMTRSGIEAPFLQLVMTRLWEKERAQGSQRLRLATLETLGGSANLVRSHLDVHMRRIGRRERDIAAEVFHQLVTPSGTKVARSLDDLAAYTNISAREIEPVLETLARGESRIIRTVTEHGGTSPTYEIFHDVLAEAVLDWRARHEERRRRARLIRIVASIALGAAVLALGAIVLVGIFKRQADDAKRAQRTAESAQRAADSARLATASDSLLGFSPDEAVAQAAKAVDTKLTPDALRALRTAIARDDLAGVIDGPPGPLKSFKVSRDGQRVATAAVDGRVRIWMLSDPDTPVVLPRIGGRALTLAFSPDGNRIAVGTRRGGVRLWSVNGGMPRQALRVRRGATTTVRWSPDGDRLVSIGREGVRFWDLRARPRSRRLVGPAAFGEWSPGGSRFATTTEAGVVRVWTQNGRSLARVRGHGKVTNLAFSPDGSTVRVVRDDGTVNDLSSRGCRQPDPLNLTAAAFSEDGRFAILGDRSRVRVVKLSTCAETELRTPPGVPTRAVALSPDGRTAVAAGIDGAARVWDVKTRALQATLVGNWRLQAWIVIRPAVGGGQLILTATDDGLVREWQVGALPIAARWRETRVLAATFDATGRSVLAARPRGLLEASWKRGGSSRKLRRLPRATDAAVFAPASGAVAVRSRDEWISVIRQRRGGRVRFRRAAPRARVTGMAFSSDGAKLVTTYADGVVQIRSATTGTILRSLGTRHEPVRRRQPYALFTGDGRSVVVVDEHVRSYEAASGSSRRLARLRPPRDRKTVAPAAAISGHYLAAAFDDAAPRVWDLREPHAGRELRESSRMVSSMAFSPDGEVLASADSGGVRLWDVASLALVATLTTGPFHSVSFSPGGTYVLASGPRVGTQVFGCRPCGDAEDMRDAARLSGARALALPAALPAAPGKDARLRVYRPEPEPTSTIDVSAPTVTSLTPAPAPVIPSVAAPAPVVPVSPAPSEASRPLEGAGRGRFETRGEHSAATVRG